MVGGQRGTRHDGVDGGGADGELSAAAEEPVDHQRREGGVQRCRAAVGVGGGVCGPVE